MTEKVSKNWLIQSEGHQFKYFMDGQSRSVNMDDSRITTASETELTNELPDRSISNATILGG